MSTNLDTIQSEAPEVMTDSTWTIKADPRWMMEGVGGLGDILSPPLG